MSFAVKIKPAVAGTFLEQLGEQVLQAVQDVEQSHIDSLPGISADPGTLKRQQQENAYLGAQDGMAERIARQKALIFKARDVMVGAAGSFPGAVNLAADIKGDWADPGATLTICLTISPVKIDTGNGKISGGQAEMASEGLVPSQVSGPNASPAARARVVAAEAGRTSPAPNVPARYPEVPADIKKQAGTVKAGAGKKK